MTRIFLTLAVLSTILLCVAFGMGQSIGDPRLADPEVQASVSRHFLTGMAALAFSCFVHALVLTYFMGTGRWMEETTAAYRLPERWKDECRALKSRTIPPMTGCILLLIITGAFGGAADPASTVNFSGWGDFLPATIHWLIAVTTISINLLVNLKEYQAINRNRQIIDEVVEEVRKIRVERGLPV